MSTNPQEEEGDWCGGWIKCDLCGTESLSVYLCDAEQLECPHCKVLTSYTPFEEWDDEGDIYA